MYLFWPQKEKYPTKNAPSVWLSHQNHTFWHWFWMGKTVALLSTSFCCDLSVRLISSNGKGLHFPPVYVPFRFNVWWTSWSLDDRITWTLEAKTIHFLSVGMEANKILRCNTICVWIIVINHFWRSFSAICFRTVLSQFIILTKKHPCL